jgi:hypothetical protein
MGVRRLRPGTATDGTVNSCGYSSVWSSDMEAVFDAAFAG